MRPVRHDDVSDAARALLAVPETNCAGAARAMIERAHWADLYRKQTGKLHPLWGDGSLGGVARMRLLPPEPPLREPRFQCRMAQVFLALCDRELTP